MTPGHDQRFKALLKAFFPELLRCFFPQYAAGLDFSQIEWLDKEVLVDPPQGDVYVLDLVARVRRLPKPGSTEDPGFETFVLIHVETESRDAVELLRRRMYQYYEGLRRTYN